MSNQPTAGDAHVNTPLTNISIAYFQNADNFIADKAFPNIPVSKQSDLYYMYDRGYFNRDEMALRAPCTESKGGGFSISTDVYYAPAYGFHHDVCDQYRSNADTAIMPDREATELATHKALIKRESEWATSFFGTGLWGTDVTGVAAAPGAGQFLHWSDGSSTPIEDIRAATTAVHQSTGFRPNTLVVSQSVFDALIDHPDVIDRIKYGQTATGPAVAETSDLAALFKLPRVLVMGGVQNTALEGAANVHSFIGGNNALVCYSAPTPGLMTPTAGYTFSWTGYIGASSSGIRIKKFRMESLAADRVEAEMAFAQKLVSADMGYFFNGAIA